MGTALPKKNILRVNPQTNGVLNVTHRRGEHTPQTEPNDSNYELGLHLYIYNMKPFMPWITVPCTDFCNDMSFSYATD